VIQQNDADEAELRKMQEDMKMREESARLALEQEERERIEEVSRLEQEQKDIEAAEHAIASKKAALREAQKAAHMVIDEDDDVPDDDDQGSESVADDQVCLTFPTISDSLV
jgi:hypothetical protein